MRVMLAAVCPGDYCTSPHGSWLVEEDSDSRDKSRGKNNLVIQSVLFFVLFH